MKNNFLVLGYFGYESQQLDGQTVKTRSLYSLINEYHDNVDFFDTESCKQNKSNLLKMLYKLLKTNRIIYLPAQNNLKYVFPIIFLISKLMGSRIYYFMIGGWLPEFLSNKPLHKFCFSRIEKIFCETHVVEKELIDGYGFKNVDYFPNFRDFSTDLPIKEIVDKQVKMVYLGRVNEKKGILDIIEASIIIEENINVNNYVIDIYGPIAENFKETFFSKLEKSKNVNYKNVVEPSDIYRVLSKYDVMLFPTHNFTEGLPGTVLDAYIAGMPVVASKWKHAEEFVIDNKTGFIFNFGMFNEFFAVLKKIINHPYILSPMKKEVKKKIKEFSKDNVRSKLGEIFHER